MMKHRRIYIPLIIGLILALGLLSLGADGCPSDNKYNLTVNVSPTGSGSVSPSGGSYDPGVNVTITATANSGYTFDYWSGSASGTSPTTTVVMDAHKSVTAHFTPVVQTYTLTTSVNPSGAGSVSPSGGEYDAGTEVSVSATANSGYSFDYWSGDSNATGPNIKITMNSDMNLIANFVAVPTVLFSDDFSDPHSGWDTYNGSDGQVRYQDGYFYIKDYTNPEGTIYGEAGQYFTDFVLEVETWLIGGTDDNWQAVGCRWQSEENYYALAISADGFYEMVKVVNGSLISLVSPTSSSHINIGEGAVNLMRIECAGNSLSLSVNGHLLASVTDSTFSGGDIALAANALAGSYTEVGFNNLVVTGEATGLATLFSDDFSHDTGDWEVYSDSNGEVFYEGGWLHMLNYTTAPLYTKTVGHRYFDDFILEVDTKLVDGTDDNWHVVLCRWQDPDNYCGFAISADGYYYIANYINGEETRLIDIDYSSYINPGWDVVNTIYIECDGNRLNLSVNGHSLTSVTDNTFSEGAIGLLATSWEGDFSEVAYDNLVISNP
jgi:uncharacterized repeat protein (TIGR02543 family)